jgi:DNA polymerase-3 subunit delta'
VAFLLDDARALLRNAFARDRLAHAYLVTGPEGSGKRELVTEISGLLAGGGGEPLARADVHLLEPESKSRRIRIEAVRDLERELQMRAAAGGRKVGIIFDADRLVEGAANAFLKTLEEPPPNSHLFLVSTLPDQLLDTIVSRCIDVPLLARARPALTDLQRAVLGALDQFAREKRPELPQIFGLVRQFQDLLLRAKQELSTETEAALKREESMFKQVGNRDALEEREAFYKALTESRYIAERSRLLCMIEEWWADVLRQHACAEESACASPPLDHPDFAGSTQSLAKHFTTRELLGKLEALEALRTNLGRNVQEQLAIEIGFLDAFAAPAPGP